jgi:hypothetical protein
MKKASELLKERLKAHLIRDEKKKIEDFDRGFHKAYEEAIEVIELWERLEEPYDINN